MSRQRERDKVFNFYGKRCILEEEGKTDPRLITDLHHVDENNSNSIFENLVPICKNCNGAIENTNHSKMPNLSGNVHPDNILNRARDLFAQGDYPACHGCYRVAAHLYSTRFGSISRKLQSLNSAISTLRPIYQPELLKYTVDQVLETLNLVSIKKYKYHIAEFISQMGLLLYDFTFFREAIEWQLIAFQLRKKIHRKANYGYDGVDPESEEQEMAYYARRLAFVITNNSTIEKSIRDEVLDSLTDALHLFEKYGNYRGVGTNLDVMSYIEISRSGFPTNKVREFSEQALSFKEKIDNQWVEANHYINRGLYFTKEYKKTKSKRSKKNAVKNLIEGCKIIHKFNICLEPTSIGGIIRPDLVLNDLGVNGMFYICKRGPFPFSKKKLRDILQLLGRN